MARTTMCTKVSFSSVMGVCQLSRSAGVWLGEHKVALKLSRSINRSPEGQNVRVFLSLAVRCLIVV